MREIEIAKSKTKENNIKDSDILKTVEITSIFR